MFHFESVVEVNGLNKTEKLKQLCLLVTGFWNSLWIVEEKTIKELPLLLACGLVELMKTETPVVILNASEEPAIMTKGSQYIATMQNVKFPVTQQVQAVGQKLSTTVSQQYEQPVSAQVK